MLNTLLLILATLTGFALSVLAATAGAALLRAKLDKSDAETNLIDQQASHVEQTKQAEAANLKETIKAFEGQGVNKFRTEIARLGGDLAKVEEKLGSKISGAISLTAHEEALAKSRKIVLDLEERIIALTPIDPVISDTVYNGQPSPGASVTV